MAGKANHRRLPPADADSPAPANPAPASTPARRQSKILEDRPAARFAEVAGGAAGCVAICCCCPCGLVNLLVLTLVRLPAGLCRKALQKQRMKRRVAVAVAGKKKGGLLVSRPDVDEKAAAAAMRHVEVMEGWPVRGAPAEVAEIERKMRAEFYSTGFWRSLSQREER